MSYDFTKNESRSWPRFEILKGSTCGLKIFSVYDHLKYTLVYTSIINI